MPASFVEEGAGSHRVRPRPALPSASVSTAKGAWPDPCFWWVGGGTVCGTFQEAQEMVASLN